MRLKPQPPVRRRGTGTSKPKRPAVRLGRRGGGRQATRPTTPLRRRLSARLPSIRRLLAGVGAVALAAGLVALVNGPWLRVRSVEWEGARHTQAAELEDALAGAQGASALAVDTSALAARVEALPSVASATVSVSLTGTVTAAIVEPEAAFVWGTPRGRFLAAADGTLFARLPEEWSDASVADLPSVTDERLAARVLGIGDVVPETLVHVALRLAEMDPTLLGSEVTELAITIGDEHGFAVTSSQQEWRIAFGVYGMDPNESLAEADARLDRQVTAVRTLFTTRRESDLAWVDVRNPGKVYFRAKG